MRGEPDTNIDLVVRVPTASALSEYEELIKELTPLVQGVAFADLTEDDKHHDISFLSGETGRDACRNRIVLI